MSQGDGKKRKLVPASKANSSVTTLLAHHDHDEDARRTTESDLLASLASLGSTMQNMEDYEQDVLKTAELEQTPRLSGQGGFPLSLMSLLAPSGHALSDVPHFQTLLTHVRNRLVQQPHHLTLLLQQQMLLNVLHTATQDAEAWGVRPSEEFRHEYLRKQRFKRSLSNVVETPGSMSLSSAHLKKPPPNLKSALKRTLHIPASEEDDDDDEGRPEQRLEEIKKMHQPQQQQPQKTVLFATSIAMKTSSSSRRRIGIQKRRVETDKEETEEELQQRKDHLKKLREMHEKRRERRRRKWMAQQKTTQPPKKQPAALGGRQGQEEESDEEEEEMTFVEMGGTDDSPGQANDRPTPDTPMVPLFQTICPLCQEQVEGLSQEALDEGLSRHMGECQTSQRRTRASRQSPRRAAASVVKSYKEDDTNHSMAEEEDSEEEDEAVVPALKEVVDDDDDENLGETGLSDENEDDDNDDDIPRAQRSDGLPPPTPLDDFEEEDYEDRVDEWIATGIDGMRVMKERDAAESPPGEEVYEGGLTIPAWVNDSLFPYQRTGLQWMWELHRQQAGGIIGGTFGNLISMQVCP